MKSLIGNTLHPLLPLAFLALAAFGCDDGAQRGRVVVSGSSSRAVANVPGTLTVVQGDTQPLLYIFALAPSLTASGSGSRHVNGKFVSTFDQTWKTPGGEVTIDLSWDRRTDQVTAGGTTFDRQQGNVFVLVRGPSGAVAASQAGPLDAGVDEIAALAQIQAVLPPDSPAKSVTLVQ